MNDPTHTASPLDAELDRLRTLGGRDPMAGARACKPALELWPDCGALWSLRGLLLIEAGERTKAAERALARALELTPADTGARLALARLRSGQGRPAAALALIDAWPQQAKTQPKSLAGVARLMIEIGDFQGAIDRLEPALREAEDPALRTLLDQAQGLQAADEAAGLQPRDKRAYLAGVEKLVLCQPAAAADLFRKVVKGSRGYAPAWAGLKGARLTQGQATEVDDAPAGARPLLQRRSGGRGLVFDPRDVFSSRPRSQTLTEVFSPAELARTPDAWLGLDRDGEERVLAPTIRLGGPGDEMRLQFRTSETFVARLDQAALVGRGVVIDRTGALIAELNAHHSPKKFGTLKVEGGISFEPSAVRDGAGPVQIIDEPAFLMAGPGDGAFGDWLVNFLPRLDLARRAGVDARIVVRSNGPPFVRRTLAFLGIGPDRILQHDPSGASVFPQLYAASWPMPDRQRAMPGLLGALAVAAPAASGPRRIYLSREHANARPMANEAEVRSRFEAHGFEAIYPERLSIEELHGRLSHAEHVAGPYGSAFLNLAFCTSPPACLVCAPPYYLGYLREVTMWLGSIGAPFGLLLGEDDGQPSRRDGPWSMDLARLEHAIGRFLGSPTAAPR